MLCVAAYFFLSFLINNQLPILLSSSGFDKAALGILVSCSGAGGFATATWLARHQHARIIPVHVRRLALIGLSSSAVFIVIGLALLLPPTTAIYFLGLSFFATGIGGEHFAVHSNVLIAQMFPDTVGNMNAEVQAVQNMAMLTAPLLGAWLISHVSVSQVFLIDGFVAMGGFVLILLFYTRLDDESRQRKTT